MTAPDIAIALCTLDRGPAIEKTVASLLDQDLARERFELLLIDNDSTPENAGLLQTIARREAPTVRYVREPVRGLSVARNRGIAETVAPIIAFVDDDALVERSWLSTYLRAFAATPRAAVLGGAVELQHDADPPPWLEDWMLAYLGAFDKGDQPRRLSVIEAPRGGNMAFRREILQQAGGFSPHFGRKPGSLISLEEQDVCQRIVDAGHELGFIPGAKIVHFVEAVRWTDDWFERRLHAQGVSMALFDALHSGRAHVLWNVLGKARRLLYRRGLRRAELRGYVTQGLRLVFGRIPS